MATPTQTVKVYYGKPMLPDVSRVLACLYEKDVKFELIDMYKGQTINPDQIKFQAVSGFEDGNISLFGSRAMCRHIVDKYTNQGNKYLLGRDLLERASIEQWLKSEEHSFDPPSWDLIFHLAFNVEPDPALITQSEQKLSKVLDVYEQRLGESKFLAGDEFSLADLSHLPNSHYLVKSEEWGHLFESRKNVRKWWEEISSRHSWQEVVKILDKVGIRGKDVKKASARKSIEQEGTKHGLPSMLSKQKQEKFSQPIDQADSRSQMTDQKAHLDAQSSNKETAIGSLPNQKKENTGQEPRQVEADKSIAEKATTDAQPTTPRPVPGVQSSQEKDQVDQKTVTKQGQTDARSSIQQGLPEAIPSKIQEKIAQSMSQEDSKGKSIPQRQTTKNTPDVRSSVKREENSEQTSQDGSPSKTTVKQGLTDPSSSTKEGSFDAISSQKQDKQEKTMDKADRAGQEISEIKSFSESSTPDSQSSTKQKQDAQQATTKQGSSVGQSLTQRNPPDTMLNQKQEQAAQLTGRTEIKGQPNSQQAKVDAQSSTNDQSSQKQEQDTKQTLQENPSSPSVADQRPSNAKILTQQTPAILNQKEEENSTETGRANSPGESIGKRDTTVDNSSNAQTSTKSASEKDSTGGSGNQSGTSSQSKD